MTQLLLKVTAHTSVQVSSSFQGSSSSSPPSNLEKASAVFYQSCHVWALYIFVCGSLYVLLSVSGGFDFLWNSLSLWLEAIDHSIRATHRKYTSSCSLTLVPFVSEAPGNSQVIVWRLSLPSILTASPAPPQSNPLQRSRPFSLPLLPILTPF